MLLLGGVLVLEQHLCVCAVLRALCEGKGLSAVKSMSLPMCLARSAHHLAYVRQCDRHFNAYGNLSLAETAKGA